MRSPRGWPILPRSNGKDESIKPLPLSLHRFLYGKMVEGTAFAIFGILDEGTKRSIPESLTRVVVCDPPNPDPHPFTVSLSPMWSHNSITGLPSPSLSFDFLYWAPIPLGPHVLPDHPTPSILCSSLSCDPIHSVAYTLTEPISLSLVFCSLQGAPLLLTVPPLPFLYPCLPLFYEFLCSSLSLSISLWAIPHTD